MKMKVTFVFEEDWTPAEKALVKRVVAKSHTVSQVAKLTRKKGWWLMHSKYDILVIK